ncbi:hypothetical protein IPG41_02945 [Candidatus Peregrinibacteria bacterium]|nr:MAG: hypothetical protein IPG41_02945 [Candidatus Peregrinibacteria bacterium]
MKKILRIVLKVFLCLILVAPILGSLGIFPEPTADLYNTPEAFAFIQTLMDAKYIPLLNTLIFALAIVLTFMNRMALVALLILPITVNIVAFHWVLDGGPFTSGAIMGNLLLLINLYFLWDNRKSYGVLLKKS